MADTSNLSNYLKDLADAIRTKKETTEQIPAANFDTEILSIETGINTSSDNPITANDVVVGKEGYVNGEKVVGTLPDFSNNSIMTSSSVVTPADPWLKFEGHIIDGDMKIGNNTNISAEAGYSSVADAIELTPEKLVEGNTVLGIEGTKGFDDYPDYNECLNVANNIAGNTSNYQYCALNMFVQEDTPAGEPNGIWIKTNKSYQNQVYSTNALSEGGSFQVTGATVSISNNYKQQMSAVIDNVMYMMSINHTTLGIYNLVTNTYEEKAISGLSGEGDYSILTADTVNKCLYFTAGYGTSNSRLYKISITDDISVESLTTLNTRVRNSTTIIIDNKLYYFGTNYTGEASGWYMIYDIESNSYNIYRSAPAKFMNGVCAYDGQFIYIFSSAGATVTQHNIYKYDIDTNSFELYDTVDYLASSIYTKFSDDSYMYILVDNKVSYKYDIANKRTIEIPNFNMDYLLGASYNYNLYGVLNNGSTYLIDFPLKSDFPDNSIIFEQRNSKYKTELINSNTIYSNILLGFSNIYLKNGDGSIDDITPRYYGNGSTWILFGGEE